MEIQVDNKLSYHEDELKEYTLGLYEKSMPNTLSWKEKLSAAKDVGFDFIEISIDETDEKLRRLDMSKEERIHLINTMHEVNLPIRSMCLSGHRRYPLGSSNPKICKKAMEIMKKAIILADDLGIRIIQLAGYDVYYEESTPETVERFKKNLKKVELMAAAYGIVLGFETMETELMNTVTKSMEYINRVNSPYLHIYPDCGNITNAAVYYGTDVYKDLENGKGHMVAMHLKETKPGIFREVPFGSGHVDFERIIHVAHEMGIRRFVAEFWYDKNRDWVEDLEVVCKMMRNLLNKEIGIICS